MIKIEDVVEFGVSVVSDGVLYFVTDKRIDGWRDMVLNAVLAAMDDDEVIHNQTSITGNGNYGSPINAACSIIGMAYHSIGDYSEPCDCFCENKDKFQVAHAKTFDYVRQAVKEKLERDGFTIREA